MQKVTAAVIQKNGKVLLAKRKPGGNIGGKWEFPGGKTEKKELPEDAIKREIKEELDIDIDVGKLIGTTTFCIQNSGQTRHYELFFYFAFIKNGTLKVLEHEQIAWVLPEEISRYDLADSDKKLLPLIIDALNQNK